MPDRREQTELGNSRPATQTEIDAYSMGAQTLWGCPSCGYETEVLDAVMVACGPCRSERHTLVWMECRS